MNKKVLREELLDPTFKYKGYQGYDQNQIYTCQPFDAERVVVASTGAGKPSVAQLPNGEILVSYVKGYPPKKGCTEVEVVRSSDEGKTWSEPVCAVDHTHSPGDNYLIYLDEENLLLSYMHHEFGHPRPWQGPCLCRSIDGGRTWSEPWLVDISAFCPNGPYGNGDRRHVIMPDGRLLYFLGTYEIPSRPLDYLMVSYDQGRTFPEYHLVSEMSGDSAFALCKDGSIVGALRINADDFPHRGAHPELREKGECVHFMGFTRSRDEGRTWSAPVPLTGFNEIPGDILQLQDGRLMITFGVRHFPVGIQALVTQSDAQTWNLDRQITLAWHGQLSFIEKWPRAKNTIGHPHTVQRPDGRLFTVYYHFANPFDISSSRIEGVFWNVPS